MFRRLAIISSIFFICSGCTTRLIDFTIISSKNFDLSNSDNFKKATERVKGEDSSYIILFIPTGVPNVKEAVDKAIEQVPGAVALVDGVISSYALNIYPIYCRFSWIVEGSPLIDTTLADKRDLKSKYMISVFNSKTNKYKTIYTDKSSYLNIKTLIKEGDEKSLSDKLKSLQNT